MRYKSVCVEWGHSRSSRHPDESWCFLAFQSSSIFLVTVRLVAFQRCDKRVRRLKIEQTYILLCFYLEAGQAQSSTHYTVSRVCSRFLPTGSGRSFLATVLSLDLSLTTQRVSSRLRLRFSALSIKEDCSKLLFAILKIKQCWQYDDLRLCYHSQSLKWKQRSLNAISASRSPKMEFLQGTTAFLAQHTGPRMAARHSPRISLGLSLALNLFLLM